MPRNQPRASFTHTTSSHQGIAAAPRTPAEELGRGSAPGCSGAVSDQLSPTIPLSHDQQTFITRLPFGAFSHHSCLDALFYPAFIIQLLGNFCRQGGAEQQRSERPDQQTTGGRSKLQPPAALMRSVLCTGAPLKRGTQPAGPALCSLPQQQEHQGEKKTNQATPRAALPSLASLRKVYPGAATEAKSREMQTRCQRTRCYPGKRSTRTHHNHCLPRQADGSELRVELSYG